MGKEIDIKRTSDEDRMNLEAGWYCGKKTREEAENELNREIITGTPFNEIDDITTQKKIDTACFLHPGENQEFAKELRKHVLTPDDEIKLKEIFEKHDEERRRQLKKNKEIFELEERLNEIRQEIEDEEREKENNNPLRRYEEERIRENVRENIRNGMLNENEEEKLKEMFANSDMHKLPGDKEEDVTRCKDDGKKEYNATNREFVENTPSKRGDFDGICQEMMELHRRKNNDYGNAAHESYKEFGLISYVIRLNDKMKRLKSLTEPGTDIGVKDESIEDTLIDLAAYAIMAIESLRS